MKSMRAQLPGCTQHAGPWSRRLLYQCKSWCNQGIFSACWQILMSLNASLWSLMNPIGRDVPVQKISSMCCSMHLLPPECKKIMATLSKKAIRAHIECPNGSTRSNGAPSDLRWLNRYLPFTLILLMENLFSSPCTTNNQSPKTLNNEIQMYWVNHWKSASSENSTGGSHFRTQVSLYSVHFLSGSPVCSCRDLE